MDPDMNKYDLEHVVTGHPLMSRAEWEGVYRAAWETYYTPEHMETVMRRAAATGISPGKMMFLLMWFWGCVTLEKIHPLEGGYLRRKVRTDRRPGMAVESPLTFYPRYAGDLVMKHVRLGRMVLRMAKVRRAIKRDPEARRYMDTALTPVTEGELDELEMFQTSEGAKAASDKAKKEHARQAARVG
jgi:hypothetical protein